MITDLLARVSVLNNHTDGALEIAPAIESVVETVPREVSDEEVEELRDVLESGWLLDG